MTEVLPKEISRRNQRRSKLPTDAPRNGLPAQQPPAPVASQAGKLDFVRVKTRRVFEEIILQIRHELTLGNLRPGDKLPAERELARQFGASRNAVREALRTLENAGIIVAQKGTKGGAFIREAETGLLTQLLGDMVNLGTISLESLTEARVHILTLVVVLAAGSATEAHLQAMDAAIDEAERHTLAMNAQCRQEAIGAFYNQLALATGNEVLVMLVRSMNEIVRTVILEVAPVPRANTAETFREIVAALRVRNGDAASGLLREHLRNLHQHLLEARDTKMARSAR